MNRAAFALLTLLLGCYPYVFADNNPRQNVPLYGPPHYEPPNRLPPTREAAVAGILAEREAQAKKRRDDLEAAAQAKQEARERAIADARNERLCAPDADDKVCFKAYLVREDVLQACSLLEDVRRHQAEVAYQWREAQKYGVVDREAIHTSKSLAQGKEEDVAILADKIEQARGKKFDPRKDCRG